jgi:hypothetical protein
LLLAVLVSGAGAGGDPILEKLVGRWTGQGRVMGRESKLTMEWDWVLGRRFVRLSFRNEMTDAEGRRSSFEGHAYYRPTGEGRYQGAWFDSGGETHPIAATSDGRELVASWGTPETKLGRTVYRLTEAGVDVVDAIRAKDGTWKEFGRSTFRRE